jgi:hypothetical protein
MRAVEMHYTAQEISVLIRKCDRYVRDRMKRGDFGADVFFIDGEYVATASAVNAFLDRHRLPDMGTAARSEGELRRKLSQAVA